MGITGADDPLVVSKEFERRLDALMAAGDPEPVRNALIAQFRGRMIRAGIVKLLNSTLNFAPSLLLYGLLSSMQRGSGTLFNNLPDWSGWVFAVAMFVAMTTRTCVENQYFHMVVRVGFQIRAALTTAIYRKALRMSASSRQESPVGQIVNLMQIDATRLDTLMMQFHVIWDSW